MCVMVLAISVLSGIRFDYKLSNDQNEILFVVDVSDSQEESFVERDQFLKTALDKVSYDGFKVGIVTFGFDSKYVVPLTTNVDRVYEAYRDMPALFSNIPKPPKSYLFPTERKRMKTC